MMANAQKMIQQRKAQLQGQLLVCKNVAKYFKQHNEYYVYVYKS